MLLNLVILKPNKFKDKDEDDDEVIKNPEFSNN